VAKVEVPVDRGPYGLPFVGSYEPIGSVSGNLDEPVQRPLARQQVMLSRRVNAYYGLIRNSRLLPATYVFVDGSLPDDLVWAGTERLPNLLCMTVRPCRLPYPGGPSGCTVVASPLVVAFAVIRAARHPRCEFRGCKVRFMLRPGRLLALLTRTFTFELPPPGSPQGSVEYNYVGIQPIPTAGLAPASHAALWAATDNIRYVRLF
jgi:hypothetical protein